MMISQQLEQKETRNKVLRVAFVCLIVFSTAWLGYRWHKTDVGSEFYNNNVMASLPDNYFGAIRLFKNTNMPAIAVNTLGILDIPINAKSIAILKDGSITALDDESGVQFTRPFEWLLPTTIGVAVYRDNERIKTTAVFASKTGIYIHAKQVDELISTPILPDLDIAYTTNALSYMKTDVFIKDGEKLIITDSVSGEPASGIVGPLASTLNPLEVRNILEDGSISTEFVRPDNNELIENEAHTVEIGGKQIGAIGYRHPVYVYVADDKNGEHFYFATSREIMELLLLSTTAWPNTLCGKKISFAMNLRNPKEKPSTTYSDIYLVRTTNTLELCRN